MNCKHCDAEIELTEHGQWIHVADAAPWEIPLYGCHSGVEATGTSATPTDDVVVEANPKCRYCDQRIHIDPDYADSEFPMMWCHDNGSYYDYPGDGVSSMHHAEPEPTKGPTMTDTLTDEVYGPVVDSRSAELDETIANLRTLLARAREHHQEDIDAIGEKLNEEAVERGWCSEYDSIVERLNRRLHVELPTRHQDYEVTLRYIVTLSVSVLATSEDEAERCVRTNLPQRPFELLESELSLSLDDWDLDELRVEKNE